ncbi:prevent-host-death protein [Intrasporangium chromatireducens Q5-1]|uniref:Prevent-host-death protein n=1 Tax=Intrasporangium chromatireducens Q5-1 TaxID=584657 RepID=W9GMP5_9MICO|nr:prevent-host-death protein [Intrasporangium chromatireducens]EWT06387.1 prevent-host-death protein [Intrasporangium chromatireducens Q5-1]
MSGERIAFVGEAMSTIVQGIAEVRSAIGQPPVVVGGLAVLCRLSNPYRATTDLDVVDRRRSATPHLQVLRAVVGAEPVEPAAVLIPTAFGPVKVDVLEVRQVEIDHPSDDPGDRLHASAHAWAYDTATDLTIGAVSPKGEVEVTTPVAEPGPLIAMKLQAVMNRSTQKQGTDLLDIIRLTFDVGTREVALEQIRAVDDAVARDIAEHVGLWFARRRTQALEWVRNAGGADLVIDDIDLVAELLSDASRRS